MAINEQHLKVRKFYEEELKKHVLENDFSSQGILHFKPKKYQIGGACPRFDKQDPERPLIGEPLDSSIDCSEGVPASVLSAFERHLWYAQHSLNSIAVFRIPVNQVTTFAICIHGFVSDWWDNYGEFIELYNQEGVLIGSTRVPMDYENLGRRWKWLNRPIQGNDFHTHAPERQEIALNMLRNGREIATIASTTGLSLGEIQQLQQQIDNRSQEFALHMLSRGAEIDIIARVTGLSLEEIQQLQQQIDNRSQT